MRELLSEQNIDYMERAHEVAEKYVRPQAAELDRTGEYGWDILEALKSAELTGVWIPKEYGGKGGGVVDLCLIVEQISRACGGVSFIQRPVVLVLPPVPPLGFDAGAGLAKGRADNTPVAADVVGIVKGREAFGELFPNLAGRLLFGCRLPALEPGQSVSAQTLPRLRQENALLLVHVLPQVVGEAPRDIGRPLGVSACSFQRVDEEHRLAMIRRDRRQRPAVFRHLSAIYKRWEQRLFLSLMVKTGNEHPEKPDEVGHIRRFDTARRRPLGKTDQRARHVVHQAVLLTELVEQQHQSTAGRTTPAAPGPRGS